MSIKQLETHWKLFPERCIDFEYALSARFSFIRNSHRISNIMLCCARPALLAASQTTVALWRSLVTDDKSRTLEFVPLFVNSSPPRNHLQIKHKQLQWKVNVGKQQPHWSANSILKLFTLLLCITIMAKWSQMAKASSVSTTTNPYSTQ